MIKKFALCIISGLCILLITSCVSTGTPVIVTSIPTSISSTQKVLPSATSIQPTEIPTTIPPTAIPTIEPVNPIQHFTSGQEFTITSIHMVDATLGWAIGGLLGAGDHVLHTSNGGATWTDLTPPEEAALSGEQKTATGYFQDAQSAWVIYANQSGQTPANSVVWRTQDGGTTWLASQPLDLRELNEFYEPSDLQFVDGQSGWILVHVGVGMNHDYVVLYRSTDGGATWERLIDPYNDTTGIMSCSKTSMLFTDATHGWLTGDCNGVAAGALLFRTADAGATWEKVSLPEPGDYPGLFSNESMVACGSYDPFFFGNDIGHLNVKCQDYQGTQITYSYYIYTTNDGGTTWTSSTYPGESLYFLTADTGWALAQKIQRTTDGGLTWAPISEVTWSVQLDFISDQIGWGVARADNQIALVKTENGGAKWQMLTPTVGP